MVLFNINAMNVYNTNITMAEIENLIFDNELHDINKITFGAV